MFNVKSFEGPLLTAEQAEGSNYMDPKTEALLRLPEIPSMTLLWGRAGLREGSEGDQLRLDVLGPVCYLCMCQTILLLHLPQWSAVDEGEHSKHNLYQSAR